MKLQHAIILVLCFHPIAYGSSASQEPRVPTLRAYALKAYAKSGQRPVDGEVPSELMPALIAGHAGHVRSTIAQIHERVRNCPRPPRSIIAAAKSEITLPAKGRASLKLLILKPTQHLRYMSSLGAELERIIEVDADNNARELKADVMRLIHQQLRFGVKPIIDAAQAYPQIFTKLSNADLNYLESIMKNDRRSFESLAANGADMINAAAARQDIEGITNVINLLNKQLFANNHGRRRGEFVRIA